MAAQVEHISDDGLTALCGESLISDGPAAGPECPGCRQRAMFARYVWPRVGPPAVVLVWLVALGLGRYAADLSTPARMGVALGSTISVLAVIMLAGRVRPTDTGGE